MLIMVNNLIWNMIQGFILVHFFFSDFDWCENVIFGFGNISSMHIGIKKEDIFVLGKGPTQRLNDTTIIAEAKYTINFSRLHKKMFV